MSHAPLYAAFSHPNLILRQCSIEGDRQGRTEERLVVDAENPCKHCSNAGLVVMDHHPPHLGWPCPMCELGSMRASELTLGTLDPRAYPPEGLASVPSFYEGKDLSKLSWNGGLTLAHHHPCSHDWCVEVTDTRGEPCELCRTKAARARGERVVPEYVREAFRRLGEATATA